MIEFRHTKKKKGKFVRIGNCVSDVVVTNAGAPQGTRAGPNDFKVLINDLSFESPYVKYVDDVTVAATSTNPLDNNMQLEVDKLVEWCVDNRMRLNTSKTKEMIIYFGNKWLTIALDSGYLRGSPRNRVRSTLVSSLC